MSSMYFKIDEEYPFTRKKKKEKNIPHYETRVKNITVLSLFTLYRGKKWAIFRSRASSLTRLPSYLDGVEFSFKIRLDAEA